MKPTKLLMFIYVFVFIVIRTGSAWACSCSAPVTTAEALNRSTAVFKGKVVKITIPTSDWIGLTRTGAQRVTFQVLKQWKGPSEENAVVVTRLTAEGCGMPFEEQKEYLVYVVADLRHTQTGICTGTKSAADAESEMEELDELLLSPHK
jgi:hypothetical protein